MVPEGWEKKYLKDILSEPIRNGFSPVASDKETGFWVLGLGSLGDEEFNITEIKPVEPTDRVLQSQLRYGDFLVSRSNTPDKVGRSVYFQGEVENCSYPDLMMKFRVDENKVNPIFIEQKLKSFEVRSYFKNCAAGSSSTMVKINKGILEKTPLLLPNIKEQKKIAQILSTWDKAIAATEKLLANSQQQKKALQQQLLYGKKRLLDKNGIRFSSEWKTCRLGDIGEIKSAGVDKKIVEGETSVRLLNFIDVFKKTFIFSNEINHWVTAPYSKVDGCSVLKGDVFFTPSSETRDEVGMSAVVADEIDRCCYSYHIVRFRIKENWDLNFKAFAFSTPAFRKQVSLLADGSGQRYVVSQDGFRSVIISFPPIEEQREIGKVLRLAEEETIILDKKLNHLKQEKKALMQQLLTGKRRVITEVT